MTRLLFFLLAIISIRSTAQESQTKDEVILANILSKPTVEEKDGLLSSLRQQDLSPEQILVHDSVPLTNGNTLFILSHAVMGNRHYGAVVLPDRKNTAKLPVVILATGGDGMHKNFDIASDFNHPAAQFPSFLGPSLDQEFVVVIPSFRGQQLILNHKKYQSEGSVGDAFDGATTDAIAFLNVVLATFKQADRERIAIYGGSRGGTVALLASARDTRIKKAVVVAAPSDIKALYDLYPGQFKLLFFNDLLQGKITEKEARRKFIASSPIHFVKALPEVQIHHDKNDPFVPVMLAKRLASNLIDHEQTTQLYFYDEGIHGFWQDGRFWKRVQSFLKEL